MEYMRKTSEDLVAQNRMVNVKMMRLLLAEEVEKSPNLIRSTISMDGHDFDALFNSGATHSFILGFVANGLNLPMYAFTPPMVVKTATGDLVSTSLMCKEVKFSYEEKNMKNYFSAKNEKKDSPYLSVLQMIKVLNTGDAGYIMLGGLIGVSKEPTSSILIVCDFEDVFPEEIPQFPPEREIEFSIDLVPDVRHISLASY
ncbi:uncharacterized protein LOC133286095 [Gastrolobium bilobum]|uniref:uncharacterized protein LOC133286095 n=1 Tax=Gastrolobium bilobum TaxID=150636 RepID=UPI002AB2F1EE|nr:uncharacterized protein LOC133286095 [Gastrolobium bilobum]